MSGAGTAAKPRLGWCWVCSRKLQSRFHRVAIVDGREVIVHAACAEREHLDVKPNAHLTTEDPTFRITVLKDAAKVVGGCNFCSDASMAEFRATAHAVEIFEIRRSDGGGLVVRFCKLCWESARAGVVWASR